MSLVLQSSGGGQITIQEPATASNFTQTLPAVNGTVITTGNIPAGSVLQVVSVTSTTNYRTTSSSFTNSTFNLNITPTSSTSKILIIANLCGTFANTANQGGQFTIFRNNATNLGAGGGTFACLGFIQSGAGNIYSTTNMIFLDSPATTSSTNYSVYFAIASSATVGINEVGTSTLTALEIAA
jgi:hypothetical protein